MYDNKEGRRDRNNRRASILDNWDYKNHIENYQFYLETVSLMITIPVVLNAINDGFNFQPINLLRIGAKLGLLTTDAEDSFSLNDLALHGTLEHDASLSRNDYALANSNPGVDYYNITSAAQVLEQRLAEDKIVNPTLINTVKELTVRIVESGFYLSVMGNVTTGVAPKNFVQIFFREERLPLEEGWEPSEVPIDMNNFDNLLSEITNVTTWAPSGEVICPWIRLQPEGEVVVVEG
ncbi:hypothetical protein DFH05DRAFT_1462684 [Lentinula detonsa]|uniref:Heme haloperoxidase family profile domain-containing protein n=1 Tax=Lentinula detonsa TaxID=2804962 RepID=A0A9W8TUH3_9AGAR|nr:hypothetical protein DFH05DRAFT_1462684 [Lentinula detonsa]